MALLKDTRGFRPFRSSEEYLYAMKEDLAEWLNMLYPHLHVTVDTFIHRLETGVVLCEHSNAVYAKAQAAAEAGLLASLHPRHAWKARVYHGGPVRYFPVAKAGTFFARDNVSNFITWCRNDLQVLECLLFETEDLILMKNEKNVILCLLEVARRGARLGMLAPMLIQLEQEIDREIARDQRAAAAANGLQDGYEDDVDDDDLGDLETEQTLKEFGPMPQIVTNDLKSLDDMVRDLVARCSCPVQFPMIRVSEGKYRIGDTKVLIFVRVLRSHVMVRVGGGWDTLSHYLDKHDPCRCKTSHRSPLSAKLILKNTGAIELDTAKVMYERSPPRTRRSSASSVGSNSGTNPNSPPITAPTSTLTLSSNNTNTNSGTRSRSTTPRRASNNQTPQSSPALNVTDNRTRSKSPAKGGIERRSMRTRSKSPAVHPNNSPNMSSNIHRSRSPNRKIEESAQIAQQTPTINIQSTPSNAKVFEDRSSPILDQNTTSEENKEPSTDSGSEISDEGYRSLPINLQSTPSQQVVAVQPTATAQTDDETISLNQIDDDEDETIRITTTEEGTLVQIFPKTIEQPIQQEEVVVVDPPEMQEPPKEVHRFASLGISPRRIPLSPSPSNVSVQNASPRKGSLAPSSRSMSIEAMDGCVSKKSNSRSSNYGTWTSRTSKQRPTINPETFTRNSPQRRSLGASPIKKQASLPSSLQTSPTKQISAILDEQLRHTEDRSTLLEIKHMILQYQHLVEERLEQVNQESGTPSSGPSSLPPIISSSITWTPRTASTGNNKTRSRIPAPTMASIRRPSSAID